MPTNERRAQWADKALAVFQNETRCDQQDALPDLLCDLMHLADQQGIDFDKMLQRARYHYQAEVAEPEPEHIPRSASRRLPRLVLNT